MDPQQHSQPTTDNSGSTGGTPEGPRVSLVKGTGPAAGKPAQPISLSKSAPDPAPRVHPADAPSERVAPPPVLPPPPSFGPPPSFPPPPQHYAPPVGVPARRFTPAHWILAAVATVALLTVVGYLSFDGTGSRRGGDSSAPTQATTDYDRGYRDNDAPSPAIPSPPQSNAITYDDMHSFVLMHYADLPADPAASWSRLDPHFTARFNWADYSSFWSTIASVRVDSVRPRSADSVIARLTYVLADGGTDTEDRWLSFVSHDGELALYDTQRIGSVS